MVEKIEYQVPENMLFCVPSAWGLEYKLGKGTGMRRCQLLLAIHLL